MMNMYFFLFKEYHKNLLSLKSGKIKLFSLGQEKNAVRLNLYTKNCYQI